MCPTFAPAPCPTTPPPGPRPCLPKTGVNVNLGPARCGFGVRLARTIGARRYGPPGLYITPCFGQSRVPVPVFCPRRAAPPSLRSRSALGGPARSVKKSGTSAPAWWGWWGPQGRAQRWGKWPGRARACPGSWLHHPGQPSTHGPGLRPGPFQSPLGRARRPAGARRASHTWAPRPRIRGRGRSSGERCRGAVRGQQTNRVTFL